MSREKFVLVVEDCAAISSLIETLLSRAAPARYRAEVARNGAEALDLLTRFPGRYAAVILDDSMPVMSGWRFLQEADRRFGGRGGHPPVIGLFAGVDCEEMARAHEVCRYLEKWNCDPRQLIGLLDAVTAVPA